MKIRKKIDWLKTVHMGTFSFQKANNCFRLYIMSLGLEVRSMIFPIYNNFTGIKSNFLVVQAEVTGESLGACDERFTRNDTQISKEWSVKSIFVCGNVICNK